MKKDYMKPEAEMMKFLEEEDVMDDTNPSTIMTFGYGNEMDYNLNWKH
ncbi:MAG: hypothetical protein IKA09_09095 [Lachnospiraceae bacterium]|nr:hypothetical protein [Lachnospiraceae bacterium]